MYEGRKGQTHENKRMENDGEGEEERKGEYEALTHWVGLETETNAEGVSQ